MGWNPFKKTKKNDVEPRESVDERAASGNAPGDAAGDAPEVRPAGTPAAAPSPQPIGQSSAPAPTGQSSAPAPTGHSSAPDPAGHSGATTPADHSTAPAPTAPSGATEPASVTSSPPAAAPGSRTPAELHHDIIEVLKTIYDPEVPVNIYDLNLIYDIAIQPTGDTHISMTLTSPMCPVAGSLPPEVEMKVRTVPAIGNVEVELVWEPAWGPHLLREDVKLELGLPM